MDLSNSQCLNLGGCVGSSTSASKNVKKQKAPVVLDSGSPLVPSADFVSFPSVVSHLVGDYVSDSDREDVETAFAGVQPITLCLSQDVGSKLASCWSIGFLPPNRQWKPSDVQIDKEHLIQDYKGCLQLLEQEDSNYCRVAIEVLVVKLSNTSNDFPSTLNALQKTIKKLRRHLSGVKHVVFSIHEHVSCCFTLSDALGKVDKVRQSVDKSIAIFEIIDDLHTCWSDGNTLDARQLFAFYFKSGVERTSEKYLAKFVIPLNSNPNRRLFDDEASKMLSTKIMWVCSLKSIDDLIHFDQNTTRLCHAFYFDLSGIGYDDEQRRRSREQAPFCFQDNRFIERIVFNNGIYYSHAMQLPRPSEPLTDDTPRSALVELAVKCEFHAFDLTQLNNDYFPHLAHLSIIVARITGHLDSQRVPSLKTLVVEIGLSWNRVNYKVHSLVRERTQSLIRADRLWQLVASQDEEGWSLASYDKSIENPQDDGKEDAPPSPPFIRELLLVMEMHRTADEFQSRLNGNPSLEAAIDDQKKGLLEWAPERVEKITAYCTSGKILRLEFKEEIPGKTRILTSLACHNILVELLGATSPLLQSLEVNLGEVTLSGTFPHLQKLSFKENYLLSTWEVDAPLLKSLDCQKVKKGDRLSFRLEQLPHLSYLRIDPWKGNPPENPTMIVDENSLGLSRVKHVVLGKGMMDLLYFEQLQVQNVLHLELVVDVLNLPKWWDSTEWLCETLTIHVYVGNPGILEEDEIIAIKMPPLLKVKKLAVTEEKHCHVTLNSEMPELTDCTVPSPRMFGKNLRCPKLTYIHFTCDLSERDKEEYSNPVTYLAYDAHPEMVYFDYDGKEKGGL